MKASTQSRVDEVAPLMLSTNMTVLSWQAVARVLKDVGGFRGWRRVS